MNDNPYKPGTFWEYTFNGEGRPIFIDLTSRAISLRTGNPLLIAPWDDPWLMDLPIRQLELVPVEG